MALPSAPGSPRPPRSWRALWSWPTLVIALGVIVAGASLAVAPGFPRPFSGTIVHYSCVGPAPCAVPAEFPSEQSFPKGSSVELQWHTTDARTVGFFVTDLATGALVPGCRAVASDGSCAFSATDGEYAFNFGFAVLNSSVETVDYSGTYTAPLV